MRLPVIGVMEHYQFTEDELRKIDEAAKKEKLMWKIRELCIDNPIVIAPMAGISNKAFRIYVESLVLVQYTEMVSDKAICYLTKKP